MDIFLQLDSYYDTYSSNYNDAIDCLNRWNIDILIMNADDPPEYVDSLINDIIDHKKANCTIIVIGRDDLKKSKEIKYLKMGVNDFISYPYTAFVMKLKIDNQIKILNYINMIENERLLDKLTGLNNRRSFDLYFERKIKEAKINKTPLSLIICDIDKFKSLNDTYGHDVGDDFLRLMAETLKQNTRKESDFVSRWGGEEFVIVMSGNDEKTVIRSTERIRVKVQELRLIHGDEIIQRTASFGILHKIPGLNDSMETFVKMADTALYSAKDIGRNRSCIYRE